MHQYSVIKVLKVTTIVAKMLNLIYPSEVHIAPTTIPMAMATNSISPVFQ